jgi:hypothetical protein
MVGSLALAGLGAATLTHQTNPATPVQPTTLTSIPLPSVYGCFNDPDGDGEIDCPSSVAIALLPAAWGVCQPNLYRDGLTICAGTEQ